MKVLHLLFPLALLCAPVAPAHAEPPSCADLAAGAGARMGVPDGLLPAIALVESGTQGKPWPWTLNEGGKGMYFKTKAEAVAYLEAAIARGVTNIDVGCMQLNYRWHSAGFSSPDEMMDPNRNTTYAALFLMELKRRLGTWQEATAHYHSADAARGARYVEKVKAAAGQGLSPSDPVAVAQGPLVSAGITSGLLLASGRALIALEGDGATDFRALVDGAAEGAAAAMGGQPEAQPVVQPGGQLLARDDAAPRLRNRWDAILAARSHLFPSAKSTP